MNNRVVIIAGMKDVCEFDHHRVWGRVGLVALMVLRHLVMPNCRFGAAFVCDFADVDSFAAVWIRWAGLSLGGCGFRGVLLMVGVSQANR